MTHDASSNPPAAPPTTGAATDDHATAPQPPSAAAPGPLAPPARPIDRCLRCSHTWRRNTRTGLPARRCPACGSYAWADATPEWTCRWCGYQWYSWRGRKLQGPPAACPKCQRRDWNAGEAAADAAPDDVAAPTTARAPGAGAETTASVTRMKRPWEE